MKREDYPLLPRAVYGIAKGVEMYYIRPFVKDLGKVAINYLRRSK